MRIAAAFDKGADRRCRFRLAEQHAVHAAAEDLAELPCIEADIGSIGAVDRRLDDHRRRAMTRARRAALDEPAHIFGEPRHVERPVLHPDIYVIGPDMRVLAPLRIGQHVAAMTAGVIDRLILLQKLDGSVNAVRHGFPVQVSSDKKSSDARAHMSTDYPFGASRRCRGNRSRARAYKPMAAPGWRRRAPNKRRRADPRRGRIPRHGSVLPTGGAATDWRAAQRLRGYVIAANSASAELRAERETIAAGPNETESASQ